MSIVSNSIVAFSMSADAFAAAISKGGATLALLNVNIWIMAGMIGIATVMMATIGIMTSHYIGTKILIQHLELLS